MLDDSNKVQAIEESIKCYYCLKNTSSMSYNDSKYSLFLEKTKDVPYKVCYNCWSILRSLKITDDLFFRFVDKEGKTSKPKTAFKFTMLGLSQESSELIEKSLLQEETNLQLEGFRHDNYYVRVPVNLLVIESAEMLLFIFDIARSDLFFRIVQYYMQFTEIYLLILDGKDLESSMDYLKECNQKCLMNGSKKANSITILLGLNFNTYNTSKRQELIDLQDKLSVQHWFLMDSRGNKKDSSILNITNLSDFFFFACNSYLELNN